MSYFRGRVAMAECLKAAGVKSGDFVAIQALTCVAVAEAVMAIGAKPLWIDIDPNTVTMSADALSAAWREDVKAVVVQHTFGVMSDMEALLSVIDNRVPVIEDCCHTLLSSLNGTRAGHFGIASFYSFEWGKPLILGTGGAAFTKDAALRERLMEQRARFSRPKPMDEIKLAIQRVAFGLLYRPSLYWKVRAIFRHLSKLGLVVGNYNPVGPGMVSQDFSTTMSKSAENRLEKALRGAHDDAERRVTLTKLYEDIIGNRNDVQAIKTVPNSVDILVRYPLWIKDKDDFLEQAKANHIEAAGWYATPVHPLTEKDWPAVGYEANSCPNAEHMAKHLVSFPLSPKTTPQTIRSIAKILPK